MSGGREITIVAYLVPASWLLGPLDREAPKRLFVFSHLISPLFPLFYSVMAAPSIQYPRDVTSSASQSDLADFFGAQAKFYGLGRRIIGYVHELLREGRSAVAHAIGGLCPEMATRAGMSTTLQSIKYQLSVPSAGHGRGLRSSWMLKASHITNCSRQPYGEQVVLYCSLFHGSDR